MLIYVRVHIIWNQLPYRLYFINIPQKTWNNHCKVHFVCFIFYRPNVAFWPLVVYFSIDWAFPSLSSITCWRKTLKLGNPPKAGHLVVFWYWQLQILLNLNYLYFSQILISQLLSVRACSIRMTEKLFGVLATPQKISI